jgi:hypothetical protein
VAAAPVTPPSAPATLPPAPAPAAASAGLDVPAEFERIVKEQSGGFAVDAKASRTHYQIGREDIGFSLKAERDGFLYVFAYAGDGTLAQVVPNTVSGSVRVRKGQRYQFPTADGVVLEAADPPGVVLLLVLVSARERDYNALEPEKLGSMRVFKTGAAAAAIVARHQGTQPLLAGRTICPNNGGGCDESYGAALMRVDVVK